MSVDVEDYFMVEAFANSVDRSTWSTWPSRVVDNTKRALDLFDRHGTKATFFFVGWVAERFPGLAREVHQRGHELACHSFWHRRVNGLTPQEFRHDTRQAIQAIQDAVGLGVEGYRAPSWSITKGALWALDILSEEGFSYDSSIYPIHHDLYGFPGAKRFPYTHRLSNERLLQEYPPTTVRLLGQNLPAAGGGYLRIFPLLYTQAAFRYFENSCRERVVVYFHPWELDPEQPRIRGSFRSRFRHYTNLHGMENKLDYLLSRYQFGSFAQIYGPQTASIPESATELAGT